MNKAEVITNVVKLTERLYKIKTISFNDLLRESGYFELKTKIDEDDIFFKLSQHPECIEQWLEWSENKRASSGWYIKGSNMRTYIVGYIPDDKNLKLMEYDNVIKACAAFIKREIDDAQLYNKTKKK